MRRNITLYLRWLAVLILVPCLSTWLWAQTSPTPQGKRDATALATVQAAIAALGSQATFTGIQDATVTGTCTPLDSGNTTSSDSSHKFTWTVAGKEFRYESLDNSGEEHLFVSGHGSPAVAEDGSTKTIPPLVGAVMRPYHLPGVVLTQELQNSTRNILSAGTENISGVQAVHIRNYHHSWRMACACV